MVSFLRLQSRTITELNGKKKRCAKFSTEKLRSQCFQVTPEIMKNNEKKLYRCLLQNKPQLGVRMSRNLTTRVLLCAVTVTHTRTVSCSFLNLNFQLCERAKQKRLVLLQSHICFHIFLWYIKFNLNFLINTLILLKGS